MNRCPKCNNEPGTDARFCNICGTPVQGSPVSPPVIPKRTISPEIKHVSPTRGSQRNIATPVPDASQFASPTKPGSQGSPDAASAAQQKQNAPKPPNPPVIPKTTIEYRTTRPGQSAQVPLSPLNPAQSNVPGIIRPIGTSSSQRQNMPARPEQTPHPQSVPAQRPHNPLPPISVIPTTPALSSEVPTQSDVDKKRRPIITPFLGMPSQHNQSMIEQPTRQEPAASRQQQPSVQPNNTNISGWQQPSSNPGMQQTPRSSLHGLPTSYQQTANENGVSNVANRQDIPLFSQESFAYTSKAAEHWRNSWFDRQYAEAGPAQDVSRGQATVPSPLAAKQNSFIRMRAIILKQNQEAGEKNFGFWVTIFLMICLVGGLGAYIIYTYLPNASLEAAHISQPGSAPQPSLSIMGTSALAFSIGQSLHVQGEHFGANDTIQFLLDSATPLLDPNGKTLTAQTNSQGTFDITMEVSQNWPVGTHIIQAFDASANLSAYLDIQVNLAGSPVTSSPDLSITNNGQPINKLSFTYQIGQPAPAPGLITITNTSSATLQWSAAASSDHNLSWLSIENDDFAGQLNIQQPHTLSIGVNPAGLVVTPKGKSPYTGQILISINGSQQLTLPVQLTIIDATPEMVFSPSPIIAKANSNGTCESGITLTLINLGTVGINWSAKPDQNFQDKIQFINNTGTVIESGILQPSGTSGDTQTLTLRCIGVQAGDKFHVSVYDDLTPFSDTVIIQ